MIQRIADLREPPVVGRFYLVPFVRFTWLGVEADWPVLGSMHTDADVLKFTARHYHVDPRFVGAKLASRISVYGEDVAELIQRYPLSPRHGSKDVLPLGRPAVRKFRCATADIPYFHGHQPSIGELRRLYEPAIAIRRADGRKLCPHRKVDLSQFPADANGLVTCPLHGLRVCVSSQQVPA